MDKKSNAQMIKSYYKEIMEDKKEHSRRELFEYAQKRSGCNYTDGMLTGALRTLVTDTQEYICIRRGWYKKVVEEKQLKKQNSIVDVYIEILKDTLRKSENVTSNPFYVINMGVDERERMQRIKNCLAVIDKTIEEVK